MIRRLSALLLLALMPFAAQANVGETALAVCNTYLAPVGRVASQVLGAPFKLLDIPKHVRFKKKFAGRDLRNLIRGERLDLSNLYLTDEEANILVEYLKTQNTSAVTHLNLNFNPQLTRLSIDSLFRLFPNVTHLYLENVVATAHKLHVIADAMPKLTTLRLSLLDGEDIYALELMRKLNFLDLSTATIRNSRQWIERDEHLEYPSVSLSAIQDLLRTNGGRIKILVLPPLTMKDNERIHVHAANANVRLFSPAPAYKVEFIEKGYAISNKGIHIKVNGEDRVLYFPGLILPNAFGRNENESELSEYLETFVDTLARENAEAYLSGPFSFTPGVVYGDIMFRRVIGGETKLFSLRNAIEFLQFAVPAKSSWKTHLIREKPNFTDSLNRHLLLRSHGAFNRIGPLEMP